MRHWSLVGMAIVANSVNAFAVECAPSLLQSGLVYAPTINVVCGGKNGKLPVGARLNSITLEVNRAEDFAQAKLLLSCKVTSPTLSVGEYHHVSVVTGGGNGPSNSEKLIDVTKDDILKSCPGAENEAVLKSVSSRAPFGNVNIWYGRSFEVSDSDVVYEAPSQAGSYRVSSYRPDWVDELAKLQETEAREKADRAFMQEWAEQEKARKKEEARKRKTQIKKYGPEVSELAADFLDANAGVEVRKYYTGCEMRKSEEGRRESVLVVKGADIEIYFYTEADIKAVRASVCP